MDQEIARLKELTEKSRAMVFFGGAGVSKESGIPRLSKRGRAVSSSLPLSAGDYFKPFLL